MNVTMPRSSSVLRRLRAGVLASGIALASSCGGAGGDGGMSTQPTVQPTPGPGTLTVNVTSPFKDDGALLLELTGPAQPTDVTALSPEANLYARTNNGVTRVAVFGSLGSGALVRFAVPDVNAASQYKAQVIEASDRTSALRANVADYQLSISP